MSSAKLTYCGHSTVLIETTGGQRILIDPFLDGNPSCPSALHDPGQIDFICLTHGHADHASSTVSIAKKYNSTVFATYELCSLLVAKEGLEESQMQFMNKGGRVEVDGIGVNLTDAYHSSSYTASDGETHYAGEAASIVLELESGKNIYHAGDTLLFSDMKLISERFQPEIALLPIGDRFTMGPIDAAKAAELIRAKVTIPIHYKTFEMLTGTAEEFTEHIATGMTQVRELNPGESLGI